MPLDVDGRVVRSHELRGRAGPFTTPHHPKPLYVAAVRQPACLSEELLDDISLLYRDIFGHGAPVDDVSWGEYAKCTRTTCKKLLSVEDVTGATTYQPVWELERQGLPALPPCPDCGAETNLFYPPDVFRDQLRTFFRKDISVVVLCDTDDKLQGFAYGWRDTLANIWDERFESFYADCKSTLTRETFLRSAKRETEGWLQPDTDVLYYAEVGVAVPARTAEGSFALTSHMLQQFSETHPDHTHLPVVCSAMPSTRSYQLFVGGGGIPVCKPDDAPLAVLADQFEKLNARMSLPYATFMQRHRRDVAALLRKQRLDGGHAKDLLAEKQPCAAE